MTAGTVAIAKQEGTAGFAVSAASHLLAYAAGAAISVPVVKAIYFSGALGELYEAAAPLRPATGSWWVRVLFLTLALENQFCRARDRSGLAVATCVAGVAWVAHWMASSAPPVQLAYESCGLSAVFGGLWLAASWPTATPAQRRTSLWVGGLSFSAAVIGPILITWLRLGRP